ncbi:sugar transporter domain-containing protein [Phthorimaea operculella]|nr:sugar transporter domain-containing protein [Phthorimaea operculella]
MAQEEATEKLDKKPQEDDVDALETVLLHVGEFGRYQKFLFACMLPFGFIIAFVYLVQMFIAATPQNHWCRVPELKHLDQELRRNLSAPLDADDWEWDRCQTFDANWTHVSLTLTPPHPNTTRVPCKNGWEFTLEDIPYHTVVSERGWVCENAGNIPLAQAVFFVGSLVGGLLFGWLADRFGRVPSTVGANLIGCVGGVMTIYTTGLWDFALCRFLVGMSYDSCMVLMYILVMEYVGPSYRTMVGNLSMALFFGGGSLALPWMAYFIADWRILLWSTSLPMLLVIAVPFVVPESARWLTSRGKVKKAVEILRKFEQVNGTKIPDDAMDDFVVQASRTVHTDESIMALLKSSQLRLMLIMLIFVYMACGIIFDGLVRMSENLGSDFFVAFTLSSATEVPSVILLAFILDRWGRRKLTIIPIWLSGLLTLMTIFVPAGTPKMIIASLARFGINMAYSAVIQWTTEVLPTPVRASGSALVHVSGFVATALSPFVVFTDRIWKPMPLLIMAALAIMAGIIAIFLPESMGRPLPQNIVEGERLFNEYSICGKPERDGNEEMKYEKDQVIIT